MIFSGKERATRIKWLFEGCQNGAWGDEPTGKGDIACIRAADFDKQLGKLKNLERTFRSIDEPTYRKVGLRPGDLIIEKSGGGDKQLVGRSVLFEDVQKSICSNFLARLRPASGTNPSFLNYLMLAIYSARGTYPHIKQSTGIQNLDTNSFLNIKADVPGIEKQEEIACFLDRKTARIDALIEKKRVLLDRLAEKRQALITQTVTRGLDLHIALKKPGVDWLSCVPEHWHIFPLKRVIAKIEQGWSPSADDKRAALDEWGVLKSGCVNAGVFNQDEHKTLPAGVDPKPLLEVKTGDVLMCRASGSTAFIGSVALVESVRPHLMFSDKTYRITLDTEQMAPQFFTYLMASKPLRVQIALSISGAEGLANNISQSSVNEYVVCIPPIDEQKEIASRLDQTVTALSKAGAKIDESISKLLEYRDSLVTGAVTGRHITQT